MYIEDWFKLKRYPHIGLPVRLKEYSRVKKYVEDDKKIAEHSFSPLIHKSITNRKFRAIENPERNVRGKRRRFADKPKVRDIYYACHLDSLIYSYFNSLLCKKYEKFIETKPFNQSIVAYRKVSNSSGPNKCNIDFAKDAFQFINNNKHKKLSVIVADVSSFFDNLDHNILKKQWTKVLNVGRRENQFHTSLPANHYNVFKALTNIKFVDGKQLFKSYGKTMIVEKGSPNLKNEKQLKRIKIKSPKFFREKNAVAYCSKKEFLKNNLNLIISKNNKKGIPQGSPISATLANMYMIDFDEQIFSKIDNLKGFYQRYSDDIIIVCEQSYEDEIVQVLRAKIENLVHLEIQSKKTKIYRFEEIGEVYRGFEIDEITKKHNYNKTLEYLGFSYDGKQVLIKSAGFSKFYRSMKRSFRKSTSLSIYSKNPDHKLFKSRLYKRFTYKGSKRRLIYKRSTEDSSKFIKTKKYDWGNYLSYVYKANDTMLNLNESDNIKRQSSNLWKQFHKLMKFSAAKIARSTKDFPASK